MDRVKLTDDEVLAAVGRELALARQYTEGGIGDDRALAYQYYHGREFGNEVRGRSRVVSQVVMECVDGLLPDLTKIFCGGDSAAEFVARGAEDVPLAEQATESVNYVLQRNNWLLLFYTAAKDALLVKTGIWKYWWEQTTEQKQESYQGLNQAELQILAQDASVEIVSAQSVQGAAEPLYNVTLRTTQKSGFPRIEVVPPEEFYVGPRATGVDPQDIPFIAHSRRMTRSELVAMGYDREVVENLAGGDNDALDNERSERSVTQESGQTFGEAADPWQEYVTYDECYILLDVDGDGISERRKICKVADELLHNEPCERVPFAVITPKPMPHEFYGVSIADDVMDLQLLKSSVWRMTMDSFYLSVNPRQVVIEGQAKIDDVLNPTPGGVIRAKSAQAVIPLTIPFMGNDAMPLMEQIEQEIEGRTPVSRYYQGLDPKAINKTATGMSILTSRNQAQAELIARLWAETGVRWLMEGILWLLAKHQQSQMMVRLRNNYVPVDPRAWQTQYDFSVNVGLGAGNKTEQLTMLNAIAQAQAQAVQGGGMGLLVEPKHIFNVQSKIALLAGFKDPALFWKDPGEGFQPPPPQEPELVQAEKVKAEASMQKAQADGQVEMQKATLDAGVERQKALIAAAVELLIAGARQETDNRRLANEESFTDKRLAHEAEMVAVKSTGKPKKKPGEPSDDDIAANRHEQTIAAILNGMQQLVATIAAPKSKELVRDGSGRLVGVRQL